MSFIASPSSSGLNFYFTLGVSKDNAAIRSGKGNKNQEGFIACQDFPLLLSEIPCETTDDL